MENKIDEEINNDNTKSTLKDRKDKKIKDLDKKKAKKIRTLCKLVKKDFLKKHFSEYKDLVSMPLWICRKCGRLANDPKILCKPVLMSKIDHENETIS